MSAADLTLTVALGLYLACAGALSVYGLNCFWMIWLFASARERQAVADQTLLRRFIQSKAELPMVTTQLPVFNEKHVVERLLRAVCALDYPADRHEIQVLDDSTDETQELIAALVTELRGAGHDIHHIRRATRDGYKAGALAAGMATARGACLAVFDADFVPPPNFLHATLPFLLEDPGCGFVQTRWGHTNRDHSLLTMTQALGIDGHFVVEQSARAWNGLFLNFNGTAGIWRRAAIEAGGGWSADTVTEDLALSYRAQLAGWRGRFLFDVVTPAELPIDLNDLKTQQFRWAKGSIQTARKLLPAILAASGIGLHKKLQAVLHLTHYLVHPLMVLMTLLVLPLLVWGDGAFISVLMIPALGIILLCLAAPSSMYAFSQRVAYPDWRARLKCIPALIALGIGLAVNNSRGVLSALLTRSPGEFVRTPKHGSMGKARRGLSDGSYRTGLSRLFLVELMMGLWASGAFAAYLTRGKLLVGPILLLQAVGYFSVGVLSLVHHWRSGVSAARALPPIGLNSASTVPR